MPDPETSIGSTSIGETSIETLSLDYVPEYYKKYFTYQSTPTGSVLTGICPHCSRAVVLTTKSLSCSTCHHQLATTISTQVFYP